MPSKNHITQYKVARGKARSQSPLRGAITARNLACSDGSMNEASTVIIIIITKFIKRTNSSKLESEALV